jgi:hypothetical protein
MSPANDGPASPLFVPLPIQGNCSFSELPLKSVTPEMAAHCKYAPQGTLISWGIPFDIREIVFLADQALTIPFQPLKARWLVFLHTAALKPLEAGPGGFISPMRGEGHLNEPLSNYVILYKNGAEAPVSIRRRHQISSFTHRWGEHCFEAVPSRKPYPVRGAHEQPSTDWSRTQVRVAAAGDEGWGNWLWAWENPTPDQALTGIRFEAVSGVVLIFGLAAGNVVEHPLRWQSRRKGLLCLPEEVPFKPDLDEAGLLEQVRLDLGQVISAQPQPVYHDLDWENSPINQPPAITDRNILLEYTSHPEAFFHLWNGATLAVKEVVGGAPHLPVQEVPPVLQRVILRVVERPSNKPVAVKLHVHGAHGEYLAPLDRHKIINPAWFEDYSVDFTHQARHPCTYIPGETVIELPLGEVFIEITKGFEIRPIRKVITITPGTQELTLEVERVLPWREKGWVTADTHVHFLSPGSALLEGEAEGVNVVNLLASQWGELMTNVGDFDGRTTWGSKEAGGEGEYLVRVGTENRQHILGHISLLGYRGRIIAPMTTGGPDEAALGQPIDVLLTEWARQCRRQGGLVVVPHFPDPRAEHAASIVLGEVDAVEMTSWENFYGGISPYSLADWYRYLNCGYRIPAVGGTDKMSADTAVGTVRTYAHLDQSQPFTYEAWMEAVRRAETFVTYGPLLEFFVDGQPMGSRINLPSTGGRVDITCQVASVTVPFTRIELVVNGEIRESVSAGPQAAACTWQQSLDRSAWLAILVRGQVSGQPEMIAAHSSPVFIEVSGYQQLNAPDAVTILEQIEGAMVYLDTIGTRAEDQAYRRMRLVLESAQHSLHNRMHRAGFFHTHRPDSLSPESR